MMQNAVGEVQTVVVFGGTSEIGVAIARRLVSPSTRAVVLACRDIVAGGEIAETFPTHVRTEVVAFDAADPASHTAVVDSIVESVGDIDVAVLAVGVLGDQAVLDTDPVAAAGIVQVNHAGAVSTAIAVARRLRHQGHGRLVVLSSVAGERVRKANYVYGGSKAGLDGFAQGLGDSLVGTGASVLVVRPGFVRSRMTAGLPAAPFATTPEAVADATARGLVRGRRTIWVPGILRFVFMVLRHLPGPVFRRLPLG